MSMEMNTLREWVCDGCSSWTAKQITEDELLNEWHWIWVTDDGEDNLYCTECQ